MSEPWANKTAEQLLAESDEFINLAGGLIAAALGVFAAVCMAFMRSRLQLKCDSCVFIFPTMFSLLSTPPLAAYLLYHPLTLPLPTCMTFGHSVTFGGIWPNVCDPSNLALHPRGDGGWPCFPRELETWLVDVAGPDGWFYLVRPNEMIQACLIFLGFYVGFFLFVFLMVCKVPRYKARKDEEKAVQEEADVGLLGLGVGEK